MRPKGYKFIPVTPEYEIAIPEGMPPEEEAALIARRMAELDPAALAREYKEVQELRAHPERAVPIEEILRDLESLDQATAQDVP